MANHVFGKALSNHFVSWLKLCPDNKISGGKVIGKGRMPTNNRATTVLRMAATTLRESDSYLGAQFRRFRTRLGPPVATKAMAAKLARLVYRMLRYGMKYVDQGAELYETQHPQTAGHPSQAKSRPARVGNHRSCCRGLKPQLGVSDGSSWRERFFTSLLLSAKGRLVKFQPPLMPKNER